MFYYRCWLWTCWLFAKKVTLTQTFLKILWNAFRAAMVIWLCVGKYCIITMTTFDSWFCFLSIQQLKAFRANNKVTKCFVLLGVFLILTLNKLCTGSQQEKSCLKTILQYPNKCSCLYWGSGVVILKSLFSIVIASLFLLLKIFFKW